MKRLANRFSLILALVSISLISNSCDKVEDLLTFKINNSTEFVVKNTLRIDLPFDIPVPNVTTNSETEFKEKNTSAKFVKNIYLDKLTLSIVEPTDKTFSFLKTITLYISTNDSDEIELATKEIIPEDANSIDLEVTDSRLDKYVKSDSYNLRTKVTVSKIVTEDVKIKADMTYIITANPF